MPPHPNPAQPKPGSPNTAVIRGTCVALRAPATTATTAAAAETRAWHALLLRGPSGAGKSDVALRLLHDRAADAALVSDDYVQLTVNGSSDPGKQQPEVYAAPPPSIEGLLEVRGVGIARVPFVANVPVKLVVDLVTPDALDRLPEPDHAGLLGDATGIQLPVLKCAPFEASAIAKICLALQGEIAEGAAQD